MTESRAGAASGRSIHVVAGVITDARDRILLARRTEGRDLAGLWEFPGGKVDPGESPEQALVRELREELGIEARVGEPVIVVPQQYPHKRLRLDVRRIAAWSGTVKGLDGQALAWVPPHRLASYAMPDADRPVVAALRDPPLYLITPEPDDDASWLDGLRAACDAGITRVQLRAPMLSIADPARWASLVERAVAIAREADIDVLVNGDLALAKRFDIGLHLRAAQVAELSVRPRRVGLRDRLLPHPRRTRARPGLRLRCRRARPGPADRLASRAGRHRLGSVRAPARTGRVADLCHRWARRRGCRSRPRAGRTGRSRDPELVAALSVIDRIRTHPHAVGFPCVSLMS